MDEKGRLRVGDPGSKAIKGYEKGMGSNAKKVLGCWAGRNRSQRLKAGRDLQVSCRGQHCVGDGVCRCSRARAVSSRQPCQVSGFRDSCCWIPQGVGLDRTS